MADLFSEFNDQEDSMPAPDGDRLQAFVDVDANLQRVLGRPAKILGIVYTVLGAAAVVLSFCGLMLDALIRDALPSLYLSDGALIGILCFAAVCFGLGIGMLAAAARNVKDVARRPPSRYVYEFREGHFYITILRCGETMGRMKYYYADLSKVTEGKRYFMLFVSRASIFVVDKTALSVEERALLRRLLHLPPRTETA